MPTRIPVQVADHHFPSVNQGRLHFVGILYSYKDGNRLTERDQADVFALMKSSQSKYATENAQIGVTKGYFGRMCFACFGPDGQPNYLSIMQSLKNCALQPSDPSVWGP